MSRWKASGIHLGLSVAIFLAALALLLGLWYPQPYFEAAGGKGLLFLIAGVDIVLGPLITLIVFKSGKKGLKFDLAFIATVQLAALVYGMHAVVQARPAFVVFAIDRFVVVPAIDVNFKDAKPEFGSPSWTGPRIVAARLPDDVEERNNMMFGAALGGEDLENFARYYHPYDEYAKLAAQKGVPLSVLEKKRPEAKALIAEFLEDHGLKRDEVVYLPMNARKLSMTMILRVSDGQPVGGIAVDPW